MNKQTFWKHKILSDIELCQKPKSFIHCIPPKWFGIDDFHILIYSWWTGGPVGPVGPSGSNGPRGSHGHRGLQIQIYFFIPRQNFQGD